MTHWITCQAWASCDSSPFQVYRRLLYFPYLEAHLLSSHLSALSGQVAQGHSVLSSVLRKASYNEGTQTSYHLGMHRKHDPECDSFKHTLALWKVKLHSHYLSKAATKLCVRWLGWLQDKERRNPQIQLRKHFCCYHSGVCWKLMRFQPFMRVLESQEAQLGAICSPPELTCLFILCSGSFVDQISLCQWAGMKPELVHFLFHISEIICTGPGVIHLPWADAEIFDVLLFLKVVKGLPGLGKNEGKGKLQKLLSQTIPRSNTRSYSSSQNC